MPVHADRLPEKPNRGTAVWLCIRPGLFSLVRFERRSKKICPKCRRSSGSRRPVADPGRQCGRGPPGPRPASKDRKRYHPGRGTLFRGPFASINPLWLEPPQPAQGLEVPDEKTAGVDADAIKINRASRLTDAGKYVGINFDIPHSSINLHFLN